MANVAPELLNTTSGYGGPTRVGMVAGQAHQAPPCAAPEAAPLELRPLRAPRAAGLVLQLLVRLAESSVTGRWVTGRFLRDAGLPALRAAPADFPMPLGPQVHAARGVSIGAESSDISKSRVAVRCPFESVSDYQCAYREQLLTPSDIAERVIEASRELEANIPPMRVFIAQRPDDVRAQAAQSSERWAKRKPLSPLDGVPVAVKDVFDQEGYATTLGTQFLGGLAARSDAEVVARLRAAGALLIGKTNMHEIGLGVTGLNPWYGPARNPYDPSRMAGGSSSGSAVAVAAGLCPIAVGTDGGGSIRIPAALTGVVGLKGTFGRFSGTGAAGLCWSLAHVGPLTATVADAALAYALMAGPDPQDVHTLRQPLPDTGDLTSQSLRGVRIGVYQPWFEFADPEVSAACSNGVERLVEAGAVVVPIKIPELSLLRTVHLVTIVGEMAAAVLQDYRKDRRRFGSDTRLLLAMARQIRAFDYVHAQRLRVHLTEHFRRVFECVDVVLTPTTAVTAPKIPASAMGPGELNPELTDEIMRFAPAANLTGYPALSVPVGYDSGLMPIGLQAMGRPWQEDLLLRLGSVLEQTHVWQKPQCHRKLLQPHASFM